MRVLVIDVGGSNVKLMVAGRKERSKFPSGPELTPRKMVRRVLDLTKDWSYDVVSIGYPGPVTRGKPSAEPRNLGGGWVRFDFARAFGKRVKILNDAAMQALGSYSGGRMLFLGLGTGLGSALVFERVLVPLELGDLLWPGSGTLEDALGKKGLKRAGTEAWEEAVHAAVENLKTAFVADYVVLGGGDVKKLKTMPAGALCGSNRNAFIGGKRLWALSAAGPNHQLIIA